MAQMRQTLDNDDFRHVRSISEVGRLVFAGFALPWEWALFDDIVDIIW
jgi:hypothetical protein